MHKNGKQKSFDSSTEDTDPSYSTLTDSPNPPRTKSTGNNKDGKNVLSKSFTIGRVDKSYPSLHQGFLTKQGGNFKSWRKRFFTLRSNKVLYYYRDINKEPQGEVDLNDPTFSIREGVSEDCCWAKVPLDRSMVLLTKGRTYFLFAETANEAERWMEAIREMTRRPTIWDNKTKKSSTLPAQSRSATFSSSDIEPKLPQKRHLEVPLSPTEDVKPRAQTISAKYQALPAVPPRNKLSDDVTQYYGELPVHTAMLADMRAKISDSNTNPYSDPADLLEEGYGPGETQALKRRSGLYKCRSVEDFATSSSYEVSGLLEIAGDDKTATSDTSTLYDTADGVNKDDLYGQIINGKDNCEMLPAAPAGSSRPRMELPEITDYCTTVLPIPNSLRRALLPQNPDKGQDTSKRKSNVSLGVGLYSTLQPEAEDDNTTPVPRPRTLITSKPEELYDEVPVEEFYDEIPTDTRADLINKNKNNPKVDYEVLSTEPIASTYSQLTPEDTYDEVLSGEREDRDGKSKSHSLTPDSPSLSLSQTRRCTTTDVSLSPHSTRRKQDPLPPVPVPPLPQTPKPTLALSTPKSPPTHLMEPFFQIEDTSMDTYMVAKPKKLSAVPYLGPDPLIDYMQTPEVLVAEDETHHYDTRDTIYGKVSDESVSLQRANTVSVVKSVGSDLFQRRREGAQEHPHSNSSSSSEVDLTEEEKKLERLRRECNREEKKRERMEGELDKQRKLTEVRRDQELIQQRLEGIRARNIDIQLEVERTDTEVAMVPNSVPVPVPVLYSNENDALRLQIEREKLEIERERQQLEREKIQMERERSEMERMRLEHQKLILEKERLLFEKEKSELQREKLSSSSQGQNSTDST